MSQFDHRLLHDARHRAADFYIRLLADLDKRYRANDARAAADFLSEWPQLQSLFAWLCNPEATDHVQLARCVDFALAGLHLLQSLIAPPEVIAMLHPAYEAALHLPELDPAASTRLQLNIGRAYQYNSDYGRSQEWLFAGSERAAALGQDLLQAEILDVLGANARARARYPEALGYHQAAYTLYEALDNRRKMAANLNLQGFVAQFMTEYTIAKTYHEQALAIAQDEGDEREAALATFHLAEVAQHYGDFEAADAAYRESLAFFRQQAEVSWIISILTSLGILCQNTSRVEEAEAVYREALQLAEARQDRKAISNMIYNLGNNERLRGNFESALDYCLASMRVQVAEDDYGRSIALTGVADLFALVGEYAVALDYYQEGRELSEKIGTTFGVAYADLGIATVGYWQQDPEAALPALDAAATVFEESDTLYWLLTTLSVRANVRAWLGDMAGALADMDRAARGMIDLDSDDLRLLVAGRGALLLGRAGDKVSKDALLAALWSQPALRREISEELDHMGGHRPDPPPPNSNPPPEPVALVRQLVAALEHLQAKG